MVAGELNTGYTLSTLVQLSSAITIQCIKVPISMEHACITNNVINTTCVNNWSLKKKILRKREK